MMFRSRVSYYLLSNIKNFLTLAFYFKDKDIIYFNSALSSEMGARFENNFIP